MSKFKSPYLNFSAILHTGILLLFLCSIVEGKLVVKDIPSNWNGYGVSIVEAEEDLPVKYDVDAVVVGGGLNGVAAAYSAAESGAKVLLIEEFGFLGRGTVWTMLKGVKEGETKSNFIKELFVKLYEKKGCKDDICYPEAIKIVLDELIKEKTIQVLLHAKITGCILEDGNIKGITYTGKSGNFAAVSTRIIDATDDLRISSACVSEKPLRKAKEETVVVRLYSAISQLKEEKVQEKVIDNESRILPSVHPNEAIVKLEKIGHFDPFDAFAHSENSINTSELMKKKLMKLKKSGKIYRGIYQIQSPLIVDYIFKPQVADHLPLTGESLKRKEGTGDWVIEERGEVVTVKEDGIFVEEIGEANPVFIPAAYIKPFKIKDLYIAPTRIFIKDEYLSWVESPVLSIILSEKAGEMSATGLEREKREGELKTIHRDRHPVPLLTMTDVIVVGGGASGIAAAIASAREGAETILIERYGFLGGTGTAGGVNVFMKTEVTGSIFREVMEKLSERKGRKDWKFENEVAKDLYIDLVKESGVKVMFNSLGVNVLKDKDMVEGVLVETAGGKQFIRSKVVIDCTGDADMAFRAGAQYRKGETETGELQPMTLMYLLKQDKQSSHVFRGGTAYYLPDNRIVMNATHLGGDGTIMEDLTKAEINGRKIVWNQVGGLKPEGAFSLHQSGPQVGVRETRNIEGEYILTKEDLIEGKKFEDVVARGDYCIDIHLPPEGDKDDYRVEHYDVSIYDIPLRSLIPKGVKGLLVAGRAIGGTHEAMASFRIMAICMSIGQAAGTAAAMSVSKNIEVRNLPMDELQNKLVIQGADIGKMHPGNLTFYSKNNISVIADSTYLADEKRTDIKPENVIDGNEDTIWVSEKTTEPHWIETIFDKWKIIKGVRIHFYGRNPKSSPWDIPYITKDYTIEYLSKGEWRTLADVSNNEFKLKEHKFFPALMKNFRIRVSRASSKDTIARIREIEIFEW